MVQGIGIEDPAVELALREANDVLRRRALVTGVIVAVRDSGLEDPRVDRILPAIGERPSRMDDRAAVDELVAELDEQAWQLNQDGAMDAVAEYAYAVAFRRARAASALSYALEPDSLEAAVEGLYEAYHAVDDPIRLCRTLIQLLAPSST